MWSTFKSLYEQVNGATFDNKTIYLDFEKQAHDAASDVLENITLRGCWFHLKQSWWRKIWIEEIKKQFEDGTIDRKVYLPRISCTGLSATRL
ncbi:hypothetical protein ElyMa_000554000 [Elysia marginata]|uniref:MULE transposase domain-containing protein n=1 Tax=Elysia marginata TaxID=1093978 RepID=A0AAV4G1J7_9GAST|nr:hypothetical protein ElyMa_000554000 [Elysia marginata]